MLLQLEGVPVEGFPGAPKRTRDLLPALFQPAAPAFEDLQSYIGVGLGEQRQANAEAFVLPRGRAVVAQLLLQPFLAVSGQLVDGATALSDAGDARGFVLGEQALGDEVLQAGIERAVG